MWMHYGQFGHLSTDSFMSADTCHDGEHTKVYAYNLCDCQECPKTTGAEAPTCTQAKACDATPYDYRQHDIINDLCPTDAPTPPPAMDLPDSNCPTPDNSKTCHFWGDPHFTHLFNSHNNKGEKKKGGLHGGRIVDFWAKGVFNLASNSDNSFEAQVFFCPWKKAPSLGTGLAMRFGDDLIQWVRSPGTERPSSLPESERTQFYINGKQVSWEELGNSTGTRGNQVSGEGGLSTAFLYMQQMKTNHRSSQNQMPVCAGNGADSLVELTVRTGGNWYVQEATIRSNQPGTSGICSAVETDLSKGPEQEAFRTDAKHLLFTSSQMKSMCDMCGLDMHNGECKAPGHDLPPDAVCHSAGADLEEAKKLCGVQFTEGTPWFSVCVMEECLTGQGAVTIAKIEEHIQELMVDEE